MLVVGIVVILTIICLFLVARWRLRKITVEYYHDKYVVITGCDSGFGNLLARRLDTLGFNVIAGCLTEPGRAQLQQASSSSLVTLPLDVTSDVSIASMVQQVERHLPKNTGVWALVNNAGVTGAFAPSEWLTRKDYRACIEINLLGVIFVTNAFLPLLRKAGGRVVNMSSMMGRFAAGAAAPYIVTKYGVEGYSDTLRHEMYKSGVSVHIVEPGYFKTGLVDKEALARGTARKFEDLSPELQQFYGAEFRDTLEQRIRTFDQMSPHLHRVVDAYTHAVTARFPQYRYLVGMDANIVVRVFSNLPEWLSDFIVGRNSIVPHGMTVEG